MSYILGTKLVFNQRVRIALTKIFGIGPEKAIKVCDQLGIGDHIKVNELTKYQIDRIGKRIRQNSLVDSELKREIKLNIKQLINISCYRGFRHKAGLPLHGQRTHTNAKTCRKLRRVSINQRKRNNHSTPQKKSGRHSNGGKRSSAKR